MTSRNKQLLVYGGLLVVILFSPWSALSKVLFLGLFTTVFYALTTRQEMFEGHVHSLNHNRLTFWMGTLCWVFVHLMGSPVRILGEAALVLTLLSWSLQAFKFNQIDLQKTLLYLFFIGFALFLVHTPIEIIFGIKGLVYFDGYFLVPFLLLKIFIECRILYRLLIDLSDKMRIRAYRPEENTWFATTFGLVSHNLKTPLANVMGQLEICKQLLSQHPEVFKTMEGKYLKIERSLFQIKDQLELTIATYKKQVQLLGEQELSYVMLCEQLKQEFPDKLEVVGSPDPVSLKPNEYFSLHLAAQVLIENALHYGTGKPQVKLVADLICVHNDGDGFPKKVLVHQGRTASASGASSGVGLFYASNLLQSIGWELVLENTSGGALACLKKQAISNKHMAKIW